jgi:hypothetical protein
VSLNTRPSTRYVSIKSINRSYGTALAVSIQRPANPGNEIEDRPSPTSRPASPRVPFPMR